MTTAYFSPDNDRLAPAPTAHGPWAEDMLHGRLLGGLAARAIENEFVQPGWRVSRLTVDLFRPAAMKPVEITTHAVRQGRKLQVIDAMITCDAHQVGRVTAVILVTGQEPPGDIWRPEPTTWPTPESVPERDDEGAWQIRMVAGGFDTAEQTRMWTNDTLELVEGEAMSPLVRAAITGDIACPIANGGDQGLFYINADYTMLLARYPVGEWIGVEVTHQLHADGISIAGASFVDQHGPFATSAGSSLVRPPL